MKTSTFLKSAAIFCCISLFGIQNSSAVDHGSIKGVDVPLYAQGSTGGNIEAPITTATLDYKIVTKGSKSWAFLKFTGTSGIDTGADWVSQLRYWSSTNAKTENNLTVSRDGTAKEVYGIATTAIPAPLNISIFQNLLDGGFGETLLIPYDISAQNSPVPGDVTAPEVSSCDVSANETDATLSITGSDDSGDLFYYITDAGHNIEEIALSGNFKLTNLTSSTSYNLTITPIDYNGNEGTPLNKSFTTAGLIQVTYGVANAIRFKFKSTGTQLEYYYEPVDPSKKFRDAFLKITPAGGTEFEIKPTLSPDSTYAYGVSTDSRLANKVLSLNCGYWIAPGLPDYSDYVMTNTSITEGDLTGTPIKHQMGGELYASQVEANNPVLSGATLIDITGSYATINLDGSDDSGYLYYEISGGKQTVNAFRTGDYFFTAMDPGQIYNLNVVAKDFSGNYTSSAPVKVKTMPARSNVTDNTGCAYNSISATTNPELVTIIEQSGSSLTLGCTTSSTLIPEGAWRDRVFNTPTVKVNNVSYPLALDENMTTATITFTGDIDGTPIVNGTNLQIQWSVFWGETGGGNFFTGTYTYVVGDYGQTDAEGPSKPVLSLAGSSLTWPASTDDLSGVKWYIVSETGQESVKIFDLGEGSFEYTMTDPEAVVYVKAVDFINNESVSASKNDTSTGIAEEPTNKLNVYPNPATDRIILSEDVVKASLFSLQGQLIRTVYNQNMLDVSSLAKGLYLVRMTDKSGKTGSVKLEVR